MKYDKIVKTVKRISVLLIVLMMFFSLAVPVNAASSVDTDLDNAIQGLFAARANAAMGKQAPALKNYYMANSSLLNNELGRPEHFRELEKKWNTHILDIRPAVTINDCTINGNIANVDAYEQTYFDWTEGNKVITSGYGVPHKMIWEKIDSSWKVTFDSYDESLLLGVTSPDYTPVKQVVPALPNETPKTISPNYYAYYTYSRTAAQTYADNYWSNYNPNYVNYNNSGGDCANFVSQCVHAGNAPFVNMGTDNQTSWWYNTQNSTSSETWRYVPWHRTWMLYLWGYQVSPSQLQQGDIVYYDWHSTGTWAHTAVVTVGAANNGGTALIDAHNPNHYHVPWNSIGYSDTTYYCVHLYDSLPVWYN